MGKGKVSCFMLICCIIAPLPLITQKRKYGGEAKGYKKYIHMPNTKDNFVLINTISLYFCESISYVNTDEHGNLKSGITT